jgi:hypothetical protein
VPRRWKYECWEWYNVRDQGQWGIETATHAMRWILLLLVLAISVGLILYASSIEFDTAQDMQGHRVGNFAAGLACFVVFFVLAVGVGLFFAR